MSQLDRRTFIKGLGAAVTLAPGVFLAGTRTAEATHADLARINAAHLVSAETVRAWHAEKDSMGGPTIAGSPSWANYLRLCEEQLKRCGAVDVFRNPWTYTRWHTTEFPDDSQWSLHIGGEKIRVASYGCNSGSTPEKGVSAKLIPYMDGLSADMVRGKIVVLRTPQAHARMVRSNLLTSEIVPLPPAPPPATRGSTVSDYEYLSNPETFDDPKTPRAESVNVSPFGQMGLGEQADKLMALGAKGVLLVLGLSYDAMSGIYTFPVPALYDMPTLYLDWETGAKVWDAANRGEQATLRLLAATEESETYQLFGYLPGKHYGTDADEQIMLVTHTDGPSISQENGALGILGMVEYFSKIPQAERPRTLMVFLDCRHYMPGQEAAIAKEDYAASHPEIYKKVVAAMGIEHLGQMQVTDNPYRTTGQPELSTVWVTNNDYLVDVAIRAVKDNGLARVQVQCPGRPGVHGEPQGPWYGLGRIAERIGVPGASAMGSMSAYWSSKARMDYLDADHFVKQVAAMSQVCGELMLADVERIKTTAGA